MKNECKESFKSCKIPPKGLTSLETLSLFMRHFFSYSCQNNQLQFDTQSSHDDKTNHGGDEEDEQTGGLGQEVWQGNDLLCGGGQEISLNCHCV